jgi:hypothetical protein
MLSISLALALSSHKLQDRILIDPLLIAMASEVWDVAANDDQSLWPGWDSSETPILFYLTNEQDVLINHPDPPDGFQKLSGVPRLPFENVFVRNGETIFSMDGQNTTRQVNGVETLVVSDTLSQRRQWAQGLVGAAKVGFDGLDDMVKDGVRPDPYGMMGMIAHEAFHAYQATQAPGKGGNEMSLLKYPALSAENNVGYALEAEFLREALLAEDAKEFRAAALSWMAVRTGRRKELPKECAAYEDGIEFSEGLAKSMEYRLLDVLEGRQANDRMYWAQGFHGYDSLSREKEQLIEQADGFMSGKNTVNNDLYGAAPVRFRLYYSGMLAAALIDKMVEEFGADSQWKSEVFEPESTLTGIAMDLLGAERGELAERYQEIQAGSRYKELFAAKTALASDGKTHINEMVEKITSGPATLVIDATEWAGKPIGLAMTPFGIMRIDDDRRFYRQIPFRAIMGAFQVVASSARPVLHDNVKRHYILDLTGGVSEQLLDKHLGKDWRDGSVALEELPLPGASLKGGLATITLKGDVLTVKVHFEQG